jgi:hypothetical protein
MAEVISEWMTEASLPSIPDAITLYIDASPTPDRATEIFQNVIHVDLGWRLVYDRICVPGIASEKEVF